MNTKLTTRAKKQTDLTLDLENCEVTHLSDLVDLEHRVLQFWKEIDLVVLLKAQLHGREKFSFFDGPVTANNPLGVHHAWGRTLKDVVQRHYALKGYDQRFEYGFDTQGLWVEVEVEKALGFNSKKELEDYGVDRFVEDCKLRVKQYSNLQDKQSQRLGMLKSSPSYYTHSDTNISSIWRFLQLCHEKGWLYKDCRPMPWCPRCGTSLSAHEQADSYKEVTHSSLYVKFKIHQLKNTYLVVWTTTPWTLPANLAVAVHPEKEYGFFETKNGETLLAGTWLASNLMKSHKLVQTMTGVELTQYTYSTPFGEFPVHTLESNPVVAWKEVSEEEGTGVVHLAPGCGREDFELLQGYNVDPLSPLTEEGIYKNGYDELSGQHYSRVNALVTSKLKKMGLLFDRREYTHRYPHCWRCKTELVYRLVEEWFLSVDDIRLPLVRAADEVTWDPAYTKKLFKDWVQNMGDWCVSRKRYWGLPLPFYECGCGHLTVVGSKKEFLANAVGPVNEVQELHLPWVDLVKYPCEQCGKPTARVSEVGDCWLDAGVMPFSTLRYFDPDEEMWDQWFPADFVCEMREQVRLWFYSMMFLSVTLVDRPPFRTVLSYEMVRDKNNREMHKSGKNNVLLDDALERLGADTLRLYYLSQNRSTNMRFDFDVGEHLGRTLMTLYHSLNFFMTYADLEKFRFDPSYWHNNLTDEWMSSRVARVSPQLGLLADDYDFTKVVATMQEVVDDLSSWYLRRVRDRVWNKDCEDSGNGVYNTLFRVFHQLAISFAPYTPFLAEVMYQHLKKYSTDLKPSVHLEAYVYTNAFDMQLEQQMSVVRAFDELNRQLRNEHGVKLRQPLSKAYVWHKEMDSLPQELLDLLQDALNVKEVQFTDQPEEYVAFYLKPKYEVLGPKYGNKVNDIAHKLQRLPPHLSADVALGRRSDFVVDAEELTRDDVEVRMKSKKDLYLLTTPDCLLLLDFALNKSLRDEGFVREFVRHVQEARKKEDFDVEHRVSLRVQTGKRNELVLSQFTQHLYGQLYLSNLKFEHLIPENRSYKMKYNRSSVLFQFY